MFKNLSDWKSKLRKTSKNKVVVVEGKRDRIRLEKMGVMNVLEMSGKRLSDIPELIEKDFGVNEVVILTDADEFGERLSDTLGGILESQGFKVDYSFRDFLKTVEINCVEDV